MNGNIRSDIEIGQKVSIILKKDQRSGKCTEGVVGKILTSAPKHTRGIKVMLVSGEVGRVKEILEEED